MGKMHKNEHFEGKKFMVKIIPMGFWGEKTLKICFRQCWQTAEIHFLPPNTCSKHSGVFCVAKNAALPHFSNPFPFLVQWELLPPCLQVRDTLQQEWQGLSFERISN